MGHLTKFCASCLDVVIKEEAGLDRAAPLDRVAPPDRAAPLDRPASPDRAAPLDRPV